MDGPHKVLVADMAQASLFILRICEPLSKWVFDAKPEDLDVRQ